MRSAASHRAGGGQFTIAVRALRACRVAGCQGGLGGRDRGKAGASSIHQHRRDCGWRTRATDSSCAFLRGKEFAAALPSCPLARAIGSRAPAAPQGPGRDQKRQAWLVVDGGHRGAGCRAHIAANRKVVLQKPHQRRWRRVASATGGWRCHRSRIFRPCCGSYRRQEQADSRVGFYQRLGPTKATCSPGASGQTQVAQDRHRGGRQTRRCRRSPRRRWSAPAEWTAARCAGDSASR